jgi:S-methylmethionine-dependent homocysteine/selenocysteine methylase
MAEVQILDGGMGRELQRIGAPFRQPEWSALALIEGPDFVARAHRAFIEAGATVITTNSYAVVPFHIGEERFAAQGAELADLAGRLARQAAAPNVMVAGSLPPALGSYRPDLFDHDRSVAIHHVLIEGLRPHVDFWLAETQSSIAEIRAAAAALKGDPKPLWVSFTLADDPDDRPAAPALRSGETVVDGVRAAQALGVSALLFNCSQPEVMEAALSVARATAPDLRLGVYANAFPPQRKAATANEGLDDLRAEITDQAYVVWAHRWVAAGASIVGGCCGIGPGHIAALARSVSPPNL